MLVEDDKSLREIYGVRLLAEGYEIKSAGDGEEALAMAVKEHPDLIISDVMMPKISGFDMLDILRATPETKAIKVIMMTALSSEDQRARGESLGADKYLVKSQVGIEDVVRAVHEILDDSPIKKQPNAFVNTTVQAPASTIVPPQPTQISVQSPTQTVSTPQSQPNFQQVPSIQQVLNSASDNSEVNLSNSSEMPKPTAPFSTTPPQSLVDSATRQQSTMGQPSPVQITVNDTASLSPQTATNQGQRPQRPGFHFSGFRSNGRSLFNTARRTEPSKPPIEQNVANNQQSAPVVPVQVQTPEANDKPQPTYRQSGDLVINPINKNVSPNESKMSDLISQELSNINTNNPNTSLDNHQNL